jgi:hypothetical protein
MSSGDGAIVAAQRYRSGCGGGCAVDPGGTLIRHTGTRWRHAEKLLGGMVQVTLKDNKESAVNEMMKKEDVEEFLELNVGSFFIGEEI